MNGNLFLPPLIASEEEEEEEEEEEIGIFIYLRGSRILCACV